MSLRDCTPSAFFSFAVVLWGCSSTVGGGAFGDASPEVGSTGSGEAGSEASVAETGTSPPDAGGSVQDAPQAGDDADATADEESGTPGDSGESGDQSLPAEGGGAPA